MILFRATIFLLLFTIVPFAIGRLITYREHKGVLVDYIVGFFGNLAIFYVIYSIITWIQVWITYVEPVKGAFSILLRLYFTVIVILMALWLYAERKNILNVISSFRMWFQHVLAEFKYNKISIVYLAGFVIALLVQLYMAFGYEINEWSYDDYDYVVSAQDTISSDTLSYVNFIDGTVPNVVEKRAVSSWNSYVAMLSKISGFEVTTVCHTILPVMFLLVAYFVYFYISEFLFEKIEDRLIFMVILSFAYIFGFYSHYSVTFRLLGAVWQGKAVLTVIAVPFFMVYLFQAYGSELTNSMILPIAAVSLGASSLTSLSVIFVPIVVLLVWLANCIYHKRVFGIRYLLASLVGPTYVGVYYILLSMLQHDMRTREFKYFPFRKRNDWWYKWFQLNI